MGRITLYTKTGKFPVQELPLVSYSLLLRLGKTPMLEEPRSEKTAFVGAGVRGTFLFPKNIKIYGPDSQNACNIHVD